MNRLTQKLAVRTFHNGSVVTKEPTGRDLFNRMNSCICDNDPTGAWHNYQQLLYMRSTEQPHTNRTLFAQTPRPRDLPHSARPYIHDAHSRILRVLRIDTIHGYSRAHLDQLAQWAAQYVREAAADSHVLQASDVNSLLHVFAVQRNGTAADHVWQYATLTGVVTDVTNYNAYINACLRAQNYGRAFEVVREMRERGVQPSTWTQAYLIRLYGETGDLESARREFARACRNSPWAGVTAGADTVRTKYWQDKTDDRGVYGLGIGTFNEMLGVLGRNGLMREMRELFIRITGLPIEAINGELHGKIRSTGLRPNAHTFHELIHWHATYWDMDTAVNIVRLMSKCGVRPVPKTLKLLVTPQTAERDVETCAQIAILLREEYGVAVSQSVVRIIETAREKAEEMEEQIRSAEAQKPTFLQTLSDLTGLSSLSGSNAQPKDS
ncbi:hypothetical protein IW148_002441 [Coemansia sp. RSA 1199]|nr:hypothetical protein IW148_002441 [Coemansia sp. RSA 1199]